MVGPVRLSATVIGANTAIFSVINGVLLRPLPYPEADRIMRIRQPQTAAGVEDSSFSFPEVGHYRSQSKTIDQFVEFGDFTFSVLDRGDAHRVHTMFQPDTQTFAPSTLLVRRAGDTPDSLAARVVETIRALDPNRPIDHVQTLEQIRDETIAPQRLNATLIGLFAGLALVIATVGVAGVLAFSVSQRTNELGIRVALGARRGEIQRMILGEGAAMAVLGLAIGAAAAIPLSQFLKGLLFGIEPADPPTVAASAVLLVGVAVVAAWVPARRATAVDPITALRGNS